jgi:ring-1,2-phenylacetyl-CoA epoxidase subunit PaaE
VVEVIRETPKTVSLILSPEGWLAEWRSGQFLTLVFFTPFGEKRRSYSISSSYELGEPLRITVKRQDNGEFSRQLVDHPEPGIVFFTTGISGYFTLSPEIRPENEFCFLAAGSGIVPCMPIIKTLMRNYSNRVALYYSNRTKSETIFHEEIMRLSEAHPGRLRVRFLMSDSRDVRQGRFSKWLFETLLQEDYPSIGKNHLFYVCGPFEYMQTARIVLQTYASRDNIFFERFHNWPRVMLPTPPDADGHDVDITIGGSTYTVAVKYPVSLLEAAKKENINLPYSCESGRCGSCTATVRSGNFWMAYNEVLTDREVAAGRILTCQAYPQHSNGAVIFDQ